MSRASLCLAMAALVACTVAGDALAHGHGHHGHHHTYSHGRFFGFLDYRHSVHHDDRSHLDRRREYVFHHMTPHEAYEEWYGGHDHGHAHPTEKTVHFGGGPHRHAWGVHSSDHE